MNDARHESRDARAASQLALCGATLDAVEAAVARAAARGGMVSPDELLRWRDKLSTASRTVSAFARFAASPGEASFKNLERVAAGLA